MRGFVGQIRPLDEGRPWSEPVAFLAEHTEAEADAWMRKNVADGVEFRVLPGVACPRDFSKGTYEFGVAN